MHRLSLLYGLVVLVEARLLGVHEEGRRSGVPVVVEVQPSPGQRFGKLDWGRWRRLSQGRGGGGTSHPREGREDLGVIGGKRPSQLDCRKIPCSILLFLQVSQTCSAVEHPILVQRTVPALALQ